MKQRIRLTENGLHNLIRNCVNEAFRQPNDNRRREKVKAKSFAEAADKCPWAVEISSVRGGFLCVGPEQ